MTEWIPINRIVYFYFNVYNISAIISSTMVSYSVKWAVGFVWYYRQLTTNQCHRTIVKPPIYPTNNPRNLCSRSAVICKMTLSGMLNWMFYKICEHWQEVNEEEGRGGGNLWFKCSVIHKRYTLPWLSRPISHNDKTAEVTKTRGIDREVMEGKEREGRYDITDRLAWGFSCEKKS